MSIPSQFLIRRCLRGDNTNVYAFIHSFVEFSPTKGPRTNFIILPIENRKSSYVKIHKNIHNNLIKDYVIDMTCIHYLSNNPEPLEYKVKIWYEGSIVYVDGYEIPILNMTDACQTLPNIFCRLLEPIYTNYQLIADELIHTIPTVSTAPALTALTPLTASIASNLDPVSSYLLKHPNNECPFTLGLLTRETACLTPCGHAMSHTEMLEWLSTKPNCPVCRNPCTKSDLTLYKLT